MDVSKYKYSIILALTLFLGLLILPKISFAVQCGDVQQSYTYSCNPDCLPRTRIDKFGCYDDNNGKGCVTTYAWSGCYMENGKCSLEEHNVTVSCDGSGGGPGDNGYEYISCPADQGLSCGSTTEADAQNKYGCFYRSFCNKYFFPSSIGLGCNADNPAKADCRTNCSCCPTGSYRSCTLGTSCIITATKER